MGYKKTNKSVLKIVNEIILSMLSAAALILAFPKTNISFLAWMGLIPLFISLDNKKPFIGFLLSYIFGFIFFAGTLYWLIHVTFLGMILIIIYLSMYFGIFGYIYCYIDSKKIMTKMLLVPSAWVTLEYLRAHLLTGFSWASLCQSQYRNLLVIQIADITGMFGISFVLVIMNFILKEIFLILSKMFSKKVIRFHENKRIKKNLIKLIRSSLIVLLIVTGYGAFHLHKRYNFSKNERIKIAVVQANTPQDMKWDEEYWPDILESYKKLTIKAAKHSPDLIIWPETSFPGILWDDREYFNEIQYLVKQIKIPLLFGSITKEDESYFNSAILLSPTADIMQIYNKIHLVPFGEYIPLRFTFPFLADIVPIEDFTPGDKFTTFALENKMKSKLFSTLICFEDTVPELSRGFVKAGARLLVNITNDAWFEDTKAPFMHLQSSVFRAVENRRSLVRAANTGVSAFIDYNGKILSKLRREKKETYVEGFDVKTLYFNDGMSFYSRFGDIFVLLCAIFVISTLLFAFIKNIKDFKLS